MDSKKYWRTKLKRERQALTAVEQAQKSAALVKRLTLAVPWQSVASLHCFEPIARQNEVDVRGLLSFVQTHYIDIAVYTSPKENNEWQVVQLQGQPVERKQFDVVIVPMLGFDNSLHRLGYGGGYYDRFLASQPQARKIGVCFELGHLETLPVEAHDIAMDMIITESQVYSTTR